MIVNYLQVLEESLIKKRDVLNRMEILNKEQEILLKKSDLSEEEFDKSIDQKGELIEVLNKLDEGFEKLYEQIRGQLYSGKEKYKDQISVLQRLIKEVMDKSVTIQAQEARNKQLADSYFLNARKDLQQGRRSSKIALDYYRNMSQSQVISPQFMDKKK